MVGQHPLENDLFWGDKIWIYLCCIYALLIIAEPFIPRNWSILVSIRFMCLFFWNVFFAPQYFFPPPFQKQPLQKDFFFNFFFQAKISGQIDPRYEFGWSKVGIRLIPQTCHGVPGKDWSLSFSLRVNYGGPEFSRWQRLWLSMVHFSGLRKWTSTLFSDI